MTKDESRNEFQEYWIWEYKTLHEFNHIKDHFEKCFLESREILFRNHPEIGELVAEPPWPETPDY